jgi:nucleoid-associated protein Lsr2
MSTQSAHLTLAATMLHHIYMAKHVIETLVDDIDGSVATETITFGVDGMMYHIDLNDRHAGELRTKLDPYVGAARRLRGDGVRSRSGRSSASVRDRNQAIRQWALENGIELPNRGRIAGAVQEAYDAGDAAALYAAVGLEQE